MLHFFRGDALGIQNNRDWIAAIGVLPKNVDLFELPFH
jgi:hypothetical protein